MVKSKDTGTLLPQDGKFRLEGFRSWANDMYYMRVRSRNNQIVLCSEGYTEKRGAERLLASLQENGQFVGMSIQWIGDGPEAKVKKW